MRRIKKVALIALIFCISFFSNNTNAQQMASGNKSLNEKEKSSKGILRVASRRTPEIRVKMEKKLPT